MSDADEARKAKYLGEIAHSNRELVKVLTAINENFVAFVKKLDEWDSVSFIEQTDPGQMTLEDADKEKNDGGSTG